MKRKVWKQYWQLYVILLLPLAHILIFNFVPLYGLQLAFKRFSVRLGVFSSPSVGLQYFRDFFSSQISWSIIKNTLSLSFYNIVFSFPFPIILAIMLNEIRSRKFKKTVQMITYAPYFISIVVLVGMLMTFLDLRNGIINRIISLLGIGAQNFMGTSRTFPHIYVWSGIWQNTGFNSIVYIAALAGVSQELQEAARIDGCNRLQRIWHVDLPEIRPTIMILLIMGFGYTMSLGFEKVFLLQNQANISVSEIMSTYIYKVGIINRNYGFSTAINLLNSVLNLMFIMLANFISKRINGYGLW